MERTFIAVKPDGVQRGLCGEIIKRLETRGFKLVAAKFLQVTTATDADAPKPKTTRVSSMWPRQSHCYHYLTRSQLVRVLWWSW